MRNELAKEKKKRLKSKLKQKNCNTRHTEQ